MADLFGIEWSGDLMNLLSDGLTYAFRGSGKYMLILGTLLSLGAQLASLAPLIGGIAHLLIFSYLCALYFEVIQTTATGGKEVPEFPSVSNLTEDLIWPTLQTFFVILLSFAPALAYGWFIPKADYSEGVEMALVGFGIFYLPMAMLAVVVLGRISAASPHIVLPSIFRAGWLYWASAFLLLFMAKTEAFIGDWLGRLGLIAYPIVALIGMYTLLTNGRLLGILYREREEELNWL